MKLSANFAFSEAIGCRTCRRDPARRRSHGLHRGDHSWAATFVPAKTDPAIVERLNKEINAALAKTQTKDYLQKMGATPLPMSSAELRKFFNSEIARWPKLVEIAGIPKK